MINFPFGTNGKLIILGVPILKHITVMGICYLFCHIFSGIEGYDVLVWKSSDPTEPSKIIEVDKEKRHIIFTAETHNFPTG